MTIQVIKIHAHAPEKPNVGEKCNGCGLCCAAEPCPVSLVLLRNPKNIPCAALEWHNEHHRYYCGMVKHPSHYLQWLPRALDRWASSVVKRWIAADSQCDSDAHLEHSS